MTIGTLFYVLFFVGLIFGGFRNRDGIGIWLGDSLFWWCLILLLGIGVFDSPIK